MASGFVNATGRLIRVRLLAGSTTNGNPNNGLNTRTVNVAAALPNKYRNLSLDNFVLVPTHIYAAAYDNAGHKSRAYGGMTYDPVRGILTIQPTRLSNSINYDGGFEADVYCIYVG